MDDVLNNNDGDVAHNDDESVGENGLYIDKDGGEDGHDDDHGGGEDGHDNDYDGGENGHGDDSGDKEDNETCRDNEQYRML